MSTIDEITLVAVASRDYGKATRVADEFDCEPVCGYDELLKRDDIDAVYVPLPTGLHSHWVKRALRAGRHVLVEKAMAPTVVATASMMMLAESLGLVLRENLMFLHHQQHRVIQRLVDDGEIGTVRGFTGVFGIPPLPAGDIRYRPDLAGGAVLDVGVYPIRAAQLFLGTDLRVEAAMLRRASKDAVDIAGSVLLVSATGVPAYLEFGFENSYRNAYELWGDQGRIVLERAFTPPADHVPVVRVDCGTATREIRLAADDQFRNMLTSFVADVGARRTVDTSGVLQRAQLTDAICAAATAGVSGGSGQAGPRLAGEVVED